MKRWGEDNIAEERRSAHQSASLRAKEHVQGLLRRLRYTNFVNLGHSPEEAAKRVGVRIPPGENLRPDQVMRLVEKGKSPTRL